MCELILLYRLLVVSARARELRIISPDMPRLAGPSFGGRMYQAKNAERGHDSMPNRGVELGRALKV